MCMCMFMCIYLREGVGESVALLVALSGPLCASTLIVTSCLVFRHSPVLHTRVFHRALQANLQANL